MKEAAFPENEAERLYTLRAMNLLDSAVEERFDRITRELCEALDVPMAAISLVDATRQWFKSSQGLNATETSRKLAFCSHTILEDGRLVVPDATADARFHDNPLVTDGPKIRFYAGHPLTVRGAIAIGALCAIDTRPRKLNEAQLNKLEELSRLVEAELASLPMTKGGPIQ